MFLPKNGDNAIIVDQRDLPDAKNAVVTYHNPLDNVPDLAHHFFKRCLEAKVVPDNGIRSKHILARNLLNPQPHKTEPRVLTVTG
jgi:hypothetical protein